jgi:hypothetical protein
MSRTGGRNAQSEFLKRLDAVQRRIWVQLLISDRDLKEKKTDSPIRSPSGTPRKQRGLTRRTVTSNVDLMRSVSNREFASDQHLSGRDSRLAATGIERRTVLLFRWGLGLGIRSWGVEAFRIFLHRGCRVVYVERSCFGLRGCLSFGLWPCLIGPSQVTLRSHHASWGVPETNPS